MRQFLRIPRRLSAMTETITQLKRSAPTLRGFAHFCEVLGTFLPTPFSSRPCTLPLFADYFFLSCIRLTIFVTVLRGVNRRPSIIALFFHPGITSRLPCFMPW
jgi:hypothetical protein